MTSTIAALEGVAPLVEAVGPQLLRGGGAEAAPHVRRDRHAVAQQPARAQRAGGGAEAALLRAEGEHVVARLECQLVVSSRSTRGGASPPLLKRGRGMKLITPPIASLP